MSTKELPSVVQVGDQLGGQTRVGGGRQGQQPRLDVVGHAEPGDELAHALGRDLLTAGELLEALVGVGHAGRPGAPRTPEPACSSRHRPGVSRFCSPMAPRSGPGLRGRPPAPDPDLRG